MDDILIDSRSLLFWPRSSAGKGSNGMNHRKYLERQIELAQELEDAANARPYDPGRYNAIVRKAQALNNNHFRRLTVPQYRRIIFWLVALLCIAFILYIVIRDLWFTWDSCVF